MDSLPEFAAVAALAAIVPLVFILFLLRRLKRTSREKDDIEGEEQRLFGFLHLLGQAIESDYTTWKLYRVIVEGLEEVLGADGAALYLVSQNGESLVPACITNGFHPLSKIPDEDWKKVGANSEKLTNYLRLAKLPRQGGVLGSCLYRGEATLLHRHPRHGCGEGETMEVMLSPITHAGRELGVLAVTGAGSDREFSGNDFEVFRSMAEQSAFALGNAMIHQEASEKRRLDRELRLASDVQRVLLPAADPEPPGYRIHGTNVPARIISGDYYDYIPLQNNWLGVAIADVSGKGISAGLMMATCRSALRSLAHETASPAGTLAAVNRQLFSDIREDMFISMAYVILENGANRFRLARAGHDAPLLFRKATGEVEVLKPGGLAIGIDDGPVFERVTKDFETEFEPGDCLLLYTDGVNEAENEAGEEFGKDRMQEVFRQNAPLGAETVVQTIQAGLNAFVGGNRQMDDITMIAIEKR